MNSIDDTDRAILRELLGDSRRSYRRIADDVGVSGPTVSDRVDRLVDGGVIDRLTVELDRSRLASGTAVLIDLRLGASAPGDACAAVSEVPEVDRAFETADRHLYVQARLTDREVPAVLSDAFDLDHVDDYDVRLLDDAVHCPSIPSRKRRPSAEDSVPLLDPGTDGPDSRSP